MALEMKYFVLRPRSKRYLDAHAQASRLAMHTYASVVEGADPALAEGLRGWADREYDRAQKLKP